MEVLGMYIWLISPNLSFDDWKLEVRWYFNNVFSMMVDDWTCLYFTYPHESIFVLILILLMLLYGMTIFGSIWFITCPSEGL